MATGLVVDVGDLVGHPEGRRVFSGETRIDLRLGDTRVNDLMSVAGVVKGTVDGVIADFTARAPATFECVRCLTMWKGEIEAVAAQYFARIPDEDGYVIEERRIDVAGPATDELALALPASPICRSDCKGLCPICGTDLNGEPCDGHGEDSRSPFAALKDLFDP